MTMQSTNLLPALRALPGGDPSQTMSFREIIGGLVNTDRAAFAAEFASDVSSGMWGAFKRFNVDGRLFEAFETRWPQMAANHSLYEKTQELLERGQLPDTANWLFVGLKGQLAEFNAKDWLEASGFTDVTFPGSRVNPGWDISAIGSEGQEVLFSVKTGGMDPETGVAKYAYDVIKEMDTHPIFEFVVGSEIDDQIEQIRPDLVERIIADVGEDYELVAGIGDGLETLTANMVIDIPDGVVDIIPYAAAIVGGARLIYSVVKTEKEFQAADRTTKNKIQVVQTLTMMSKMGISTVLAVAGGMGGAAAGSAVPGVGNLIGGSVGTVVGAGMGMYLNKSLQPRMLDLALDITGLTHDDLFYYKNKPRINEVAFTFQTRAGELAAEPGF